MRGATAPRLLLEIMCARILLPGVDDTAEGLGARIDRIERRMSVVGDESVPAPAQATSATGSLASRPVRAAAPWRLRAAPLSRRPFSEPRGTPRAPEASSRREAVDRRR